MKNEVSTLGKTNSSSLKSWLLFISVILIGSNLRAPLTSVGSLISFIRDDLAISHALAGTITTLPLLAFALLSPFVPKLAHRIGMERAIAICLLFLTIGIIVRSLPGVSLLFIGTMLIGLAIAIGNVLLPSFIKVNFPLKIGIMTGLYAVSMNLFGALASGLSVPFSNVNGVGWQGALGLWGILSFIALLIWIPQLKKRYSSQSSTNPAMKKSKSLWKSPLAWQVTLFMGLQSFMFYTLVTWLPEIVQSNGYSSEAAGWMLSLMQFSIIPITFIIPIIAEKMKNQMLLGAMTAVFFLLGISGLLFGNTALIPVSVIITGIAGGSAFGLAMMFFSLRTTDGKQAAELSGMAQSIGYLLAALGPVLFGALHDLTNGWETPLSMLLLIAFVIFIVGVGAGKNRVISPEENITSQKVG
ncbi:MFS transporter [bacterium LRH843]|nr:MFS transporter [bacterium LRH843]